jgi:hypothetical protein
MPGVVETVEGTAAACAALAPTAINAASERVWIGVFMECSLDGG